jgi:deoxyribonuclease V
MASPSIGRAVALQRRLAGRVERRDRTGRVRTIAGVDVSVAGGRSRAAVVVLDARTLAPIETATADATVAFPYVPGLLAFREVPVLRRAFRRLKRRPDLAIVDGMGLIHPRRCGLACHLGVVLDLPTIGCGKSYFIGEYAEPAAARGSWSPLTFEGERLGAAVRTRDGVNIVFVSTGHRVSLATAIRWVVRTATRARLPEPVRHAHRAASLVES